MDAVWPRVTGWVDASLPKEPLFNTPEDIREDAIKGDVALWVVCDGKQIVGVLASRPLQYKRFRAIDLFVVGGQDFDRWKAPAFAHIRDHAKAHGCAYIAGGGRGGWKRGFGKVHDLGNALFLEVE